MSAWTKAIIVILIGFILWWGTKHWGELHGALMLFKQLTWRSLFLLFLLQFFYTLCLAASNKGLYHALGVSTGLIEQTMLILTSGVANRLIPLGGVSGIGSFLYLASARGIPTSATVQMTAVSIVLGYLQTVPIAVILLAFGQIGHHLSSGPSQIQILQVGWLMLAAAAATLIGVWIVSLPVVGNWLAGWTITSRHIKKLQDTLLSVHRYATWSLQNSRKLIAPLLFLLLLYPIRLLMLSVCFNAFHTQLPFVWMMIGYTLALLVSNLSILPTNLGFFEATLIASFHSFGISVQAATAITLLYRSFTFWIPIPFGLLAYAYFRRQNSLDQRERVLK